jgi:predicted ribosomally synthesized peptide with SipW-like signal peptide
MKKTIFNKKSATIAIVGAVALTMVGTMAYFTDYATTQANGTAGTVAIALDSQIDLKDANGMDILNPGDMREGMFTVTNMGNKSIDVRTTLALTALDHEGNAINFTGDAESQSEYDLYLASDVELVAGEGYKPVTGAKPIEVKSIEGNVIKYAIADYSLNGNSDEYAEVETIDGIDAFAHDYDFVLVFKGETGNEWQASTIQLDVIVEAKQHENTGAGWDIVAQESLTQGSLTQDVVMGEVVITPDN